MRADRGGDVTYHGPGQLVGYPILDRAPGAGRRRRSPTPVAYVRSVEQLVIDALADLGRRGRPPRRLPRRVGRHRPGRARKICAIGVRLTRGRTMHGFALNVDPDLAMFGHIVPCGIADKAVTSLAAEGVDVDDARGGRRRRPPRRRAVGPTAAAERQDVAWRARPDDLAPFSRRAAAARGAGASRRWPLPRSRARLAEAGVTEGLSIRDRKPEWMRARVRITDDYLRLKRTMRDLDLVTVCEEAGCPNIFECWADGTATFMINGERCTRACGFCLVDTRHPEPLDPGEPERVAEAVDRMGLAHAVVTAVARDDLPDGGAAAFAATIAGHPRAARRPPRSRCSSPTARATPTRSAAIFDARPDVLNHNLETVARLQRAVRPSAATPAAWPCWPGPRRPGSTTKSGLIVGMGETDDEVAAALADLAAVGVDIVTIGQYLRPTTHHLPVARWWTPEDVRPREARRASASASRHVEASPAHPVELPRPPGAPEAARGRSRRQWPDGPRQYESLTDGRTRVDRPPADVLRGHGARRATAVT